MVEIIYTSCREVRITVLFFVYVMEYSAESLGRDLKSVRKYFGSGKTKEESWRESQLKGLQNFLVEREEEILKALKKDLGKHYVEAFRDEVCV